MVSISRNHYSLHFIIFYEVYICHEMFYFIILIYFITSAGHTLDRFLSSDSVRNFSTSNQELYRSSLLWLHVPKTGSTFCSTLHHLGCDSFDQISSLNMSIWGSCALPVDMPTECSPDINHWKRTVFSGHRPFKMSMIRTEKVIAIGMFRHPRSRLLSAFLDGWHHEGMYVEVWMKLKLQLRALLHKLNLSTKSQNMSAIHSARSALAQKYFSHDNSIG